MCKFLPLAKSEAQKKVIHHNITFFGPLIGQEVKIWFSKFLTKLEFGSTILLSDKNLHLIN